MGLHPWRIRINHVLVLALIAPWVAVLALAQPLPATAATDGVVPLPPERLLDTRAGFDAPGPKGRVGAKQVVEVQVAGVGEVPEGASAAFLNVTAVAPSAAGFLTVFPCDGKPDVQTSNVNYAAGSVSPNAVLSKLSADGRACVRTLAETDVIVDVNGFVPGGSGAVVPLSPDRVLDSRAGFDAPGPKGRVGAKQVVEVQVAGVGEVPEGASAAFLNVTAVAPSAAGFLTVFPCDGKPDVQTSNVNYAAGSVSPNAVLSKLSADGRACVRTLAETDVIVDVNGFVPGGSGAVVPLSPDRVLDSRAGFDAPGPKGRVGAKQVVEVQVAGVGEVPEGASAAFLNVTAVAPSAAGFLTVFPCDGKPDVQTSNVNYAAGSVSPNAVLSKLSADGRACVRTLAETDVIVDVNGFVPADGACISGGSELSIDSHNNGDNVDTGENGTLTGSFFLEGAAPVGTTDVTVSVLGENGAAELDTSDCTWSIESQVLSTGNRTYEVTSSGPYGEQTTTIELYTVEAAPDDTLLAPSFVETEQNAGKLISYNNDTGVLRFAGDITDDLEFDDGLSSEPNAIAPHGYLLKVTAFRFDGTNTIVETRQAALHEFIRRIDIQHTAEPGSAELNSMRFATGDPEAETAGLTTDPSTERTGAEGGSSDPMTGVLAAATVGDGAFEFQADFNFNPGFDVDLQIDFRRDNCTWCLPTVVVDRIFFEASAEISAEAELTYKAATLYKKEGKFGPRLDDFKLGQLVIPLPVGAIVLTLEAEGQAFYEVSVDAAMKVGYQATLTFKAGFEHKGDGTGRGAYTDSSFDNGMKDGLQFAAGIKATAAVGIEMDLEILFFGQAGFEIEAKPKLQAEAFVDGANNEIKWKLDFVVPIAAGLEVEIKIGPIDFDKEYGGLEFAQISIRIAEGMYTAGVDEEPTDDVVDDSTVEPVDDNTGGGDGQIDKVEGFVPGEQVWVLSTGKVAEAVGDDPTFHASTDLGQPGDTRLSELSGFSTGDAASYTVSVIPTGSTLHVEFLFGSEEYEEFVDSSFNDVMAVFVDGNNCALVPGTQQPISVNTVNHLRNTKWYLGQPGPEYNTTMDGLTVPMKCSVPVTKGQQVTVTIAVADATDRIYDSAVALVNNGISSS